MHPGEISEFQWERPLGSTRIPTTFQVRTRPKTSWGVRLGPLIRMEKDRRWNSVFFKLTIHFDVLLFSTIIELSIYMLRGAPDIVSGRIVTKSYTV
jgi:hypothetical protein